MFFIFYCCFFFALLSLARVAVACIYVYQWAYLGLLLLIIF